LLMSPVPSAERILQAAGCRPLTFTPYECLLIRSPWNACRFTPSLSRLKALALLLVGLPQTCVWAVMRRLLLPLSQDFMSLPMGASFASRGDPQEVTGNGGSGPGI